MVLSQRAMCNSLTLHLCQHVKRLRHYHHACQNPTMMTELVIRIQHRSICMCTLRRRDAAFKLTWRRRTTARSVVTQRKRYTVTSGDLTVYVVACWTKLREPWSRGMFKNESICVFLQTRICRCSSDPEAREWVVVVTGLQSYQKSWWYETRTWTFSEFFGSEQDYELTFCFLFRFVSSVPTAFISRRRPFC